MAILKISSPLPHLLRWNYLRNVCIIVYFAITLLISSERLHPPSAADVISSMASGGVNSSQIAQLLLPRERCLPRAPLCTPVAIDLSSVERSELLRQTQSRLCSTHILPVVSYTARACRRLKANTAAPEAATRNGKEALVQEPKVKSIYAGSTEMQAVVSTGELIARRRACKYMSILFAEAAQKLPHRSSRVFKGIDSARPSTTVAHTDARAPEQKRFSRTQRSRTNGHVPTEDKRRQRRKRRIRESSGWRSTTKVKQTYKSTIPKAHWRIALGLSLAASLGLILLYRRARASRLLTASPTPPGRGTLQKRVNLKGFPGVTLIFHGPPPEGKPGTPTFDRDMLESFASAHGGENCESLSGQQPFAEMLNLMQDAAKARGEQLNRKEAIRLLRKVQAQSLSVVEGTTDTLLGEVPTYDQLKDRNLPLTISCVFQGRIPKVWKVWSTGKKQGLVTLDEIRHELRPHGNMNNQWMMEMVLPKETDPDAEFDEAYKTIYQHAMEALFEYNRAVPHERIDRIRLPLLMHKASKRDKNHLALLAVEGVQLALNEEPRSRVTVEFEGDKSDTFFKAALAVEKQTVETGGSLSFRETGVGHK